MRKFQNATKGQKIIWLVGVILIVIMIMLTIYIEFMM